MQKRSLGLIETWGYVAAIEAGDAGSKAANVNLLGYETVDAGLVTVKFVGDVAAVKAAVAAGTVAAKDVGKVVAVHVIARPDHQLGFSPPAQPPPVEKKESPAPPSPTPPPVEEQETSAVPAGTPPDLIEETPEQSSEASVSPEEAQVEPASAAEHPSEEIKSQLPSEETDVPQIEDEKEAKKVKGKRSRSRKK